MQPMGAIRKTREQVFRGGKGYGGGYQVDAGGRIALSHLTQGPFAAQHLVQAGQIRRRASQTKRGMALRIHIDEKHPFLTLPQNGGKIDGRGGLPTPAFLVDDSDYFHDSPPRWATFFRAAHNKSLSDVIYKRQPPTTHANDGLSRAPTEAVWRCC